jgi:hypothetical protein
MEISYKEGIYDPSWPNFLLLNLGNLNIFELDSVVIKNFLQNVSSLRLLFHVKSTFIDEYNCANCFQWDIVQNFIFQQRSIFSETLQLTNKICSKGFENTITLWANIAVIFSSGMSLFLAWKYIYSISKLYRKIGVKYSPVYYKQMQKIDSFMNKIKEKNDHYHKYLNKQSDSIEKEEVATEEKELDWDNVEFKDKKE